ncbi:hypothetical protein COCON_G00194790 [Conger conger]|uniref:Uncharacterized protein n=1 Tax=Conger conger TaxID=82655 RepID=A0A9Q1D117_CONCO|nr:hypothetical protein COCON_G00194790 [Conger conger]
MNALSRWSKVPGSRKQNKQNVFEARSQISHETPKQRESGVWVSVVSCPAGTRSSALTQAVVFNQSLKMVRCSRQCTAPMAFPAQFIHSPWNTHVAVMTDEARLVVFHSLDTVAPMVAPNPARAPSRARICRPDMVWGRSECGQNNGHSLQQRKTGSDRMPRASKLHLGHVSARDHLHA